MNRHRPQVMKKRILLADDDFAVRELLSRALKSEEFEMVQARNGDEAIFQMMASEPDLVLLDISMPGKDGWQSYEVMERLSPLTPVILITALPDQHAHAVRQGIDALMEKPLDIPLLVHTINRLLEESEQQRVMRLTRGDFKTEHLRHSG